MNNYYCIDIKFRNDVSTLEYHAHLYIKKKEIYIRIIEKKEEPGIANRFLLRKSALGFFDENFEIVKSDFVILTDGARIYKARSSEKKLYHSYFTIYLTSIGTVKPNTYKEDAFKGKAILNKNGLRVVNQFYSYFTNFEDKNNFEISRMDGMSDFYNMGNLDFRPELDFISDETRDSSGFNVKKIPTLNFSYKDLSYEVVKNYVDIICKFISFCFGIKVEFNRLIYRTENHIYFYANNEKINAVYNSNISTIFQFLEVNYNIEKILKTNWSIEFLKNKAKINKAIDNFLHSREVESSSKYLLLFNIIEIFNKNQTAEKFKIDNKKNKNIKTAINLLEEMLTEKDDITLFRNKCEILVSKIFNKPLKSPLEETLKLNNISADEFGFSFSELKKVRDQITHGSVSSIPEDKLKEYTFAMQKICICLILAQLGFKEEIKTVHNHL